MAVLRISRAYRWIRRRVTDDDFMFLVQSVLPYGEGYICMVKAYFDTSGTTDPTPALCVAGVIFPAARAEVFVRKWDKHCKRIGIDYFRMTECYRLDGQFKHKTRAFADAAEKKLASLIRSHAQHMVTVCVSRDEWPKKVPEWWDFGSTETGAFHAWLSGMASWIHRARHPVDERMAYIFEGGPNEADLICELSRSVQRPENKHEIRHYTHFPVYKGQREHRPCDAADYVAWNIRRLYAMDPNHPRFDSGEPDLNELRQPFHHAVGKVGLETANLTGSRLDLFFQYSKPLATP